MEERFEVININSFMSNDESIQEVNEIINSFSSPQNEDIESFLKNNSILSTKKGQTVTYLVFSTFETTDFVGYFTLTIKPITIKSDSIKTKSLKKRIERVCKIDENGFYTLSAFLIAQLGKNYSLGKQRRIEGKKLLGIAQDTLSYIKEQVGGVIVFLECEESENDFLINFYNDNGFSLFGERISDKNKKLYQLIKAI